MEVYAGMDVHSTSCTVALVNAQGKHIKQEVLATNGSELISFFKAQRGRVHLCLEEGTQSSWLWEILTPHVFEVVVAGVSEKRHGRKDDAGDALHWAEQVRVGAIRQRVYKGSGPYSALRQLVFAHRVLVQDTVRMQNRIKAMYRSRGILVSGTEVYRESARERFLLALPSGCQAATELLYQAYDGLAAQRKAAHKALVTEVHQHAVSRILETCPGMGEIRVAQLLAIGINPDRFRTRKQFWAYCGLGIVMRSSSDWKQDPQGRWVKAPVQQTRGLNWNHNRMLKCVFKGAATTAIMQHTGVMRETYDRLTEAGTKPNLAKLTVARKIAATALSMWKHKETYQPDKNKPKT